MSVVWIESAGGPLLVAPESKLAHWSGSTDDDGPVETWGDYGRACQVQDCIGLVDVGGQQALVLGDEPATTTYLADERLFLRWAPTPKPNSSKRTTTSSSTSSPAAIESARPI